MIIMLLYTAVVMPYKIALIEDDKTDVLYYIDTAVDFITGLQASSLSSSSPTILAVGFDAHITTTWWDDIILYIIVQ